MNASCQSPVGSYAIVEEENCIIESIVATPDGTKILRKSVKGNINEVKDLGAKLAQQLIKIGANDLINND